MPQFVEEIDSKILNIFNILSSLKEDLVIEKFLSYSIEKIFETYTIQKMGMVLFEGETEKKEFQLKIKISRGLSGDEIKSFHKNYINDENFLKKILKFHSALLLDLETIDLTPFKILQFNIEEGFLGVFPLNIENETRGFLFILTQKEFNEVDILLFNSILSLTALALRYDNIKERFKRESFYSLTLPNVHNIKFLLHDLKKEIARCKHFKRNLTTVVIEISNHEEILYTWGSIKTRMLVLQVYEFFMSILSPYDYTAIRNNEKQIVLVMPEKSAEEVFLIVSQKMKELNSLSLTAIPVLNIGIGDLLEKNGKEMSPLEKSEIALEEATRITDSTVIVFGHPDLIWKKEI